MANTILPDAKSLHSRREFLSIPIACALTGMRTGNTTTDKKRIAAVMTTYWRMSHAEVIVGRLLDGYYYNGERRNPRIQVVSMYVDQFPENDMSRDKAAEYNIPIFKSIREALTMGGKDLAVDGVVIIGEHGEYPYNIKGQQLYPRFYFYKQVIDVFRETGRSVPVFTDKHFSYDWDEALWMYKQSKQLGFPLMAGSSLPLAWRRPELELELGTPVERAVVTNYGPKERYGIHTLEALQCMVERRKGGETGIAAVQCFEGDPVWEWTGTNPWAGRLLNAALECCPGRKQGNPRHNVRKPYLFVLEYKSGLQAACYLLNGHVTSAAFAADITGKGKPTATQFFLQPGRPYGHFSGLVYFIEKMMINGKTSYPVERTLLTTGALSALFDSSYENMRIVKKGRRLETPHLAISYQPQKESLFNRGPLPPTDKEFGIGP